VGGSRIFIFKTGTVYSVRFLDTDGNVYVRDLNWNGSGWVSIKISRSGGNIVFSEDGVQQTVLILAAINIYSSAFQTVAGNAMHIFDIRVLPNNVSDEAYSYYYNNVTGSNGNVFLY